MSSFIKILECRENLDKIKFRNTFIARLDGQKAKDAKSFYHQIKKIFDLPDYFGNNLDALYDCLMDLEWIVEPKIAFIIENFEDVLVDEEENDPDLIEDFITILDEVIQSWLVFDSDLIDPKQFAIYFVESEKARIMLEENGIEFS